MLRSQKIPARMVVGYKCDEWNAVGGYYQVRQLHAHTWVEAYLAPEAIAAEADARPRLLATGRTVDGCGSIRRLADRRPESRPLGSLAFADARDWLEFGWSNYVVELDFERQRNAIYEPIGRRGAGRGGRRPIPIAGTPQSMPCWPRCIWINSAAWLPGCWAWSRRWWRRRCWRDSAGCSGGWFGAGACVDGQPSCRRPPRPTQRNRVLPPFRDPAGPAGHRSRRRPNATGVCRSGRACAWLI